MGATHGANRHPYKTNLNVIRDACHEKFHSDIWVSHGSTESGRDLIFRESHFGELTNVVRVGSGRRSWCSRRGCRRCRRCSRGGRWRGSWGSRCGRGWLGLQVSNASSEESGGGNTTSQRDDDARSSCIPRYREHSAAVMAYRPAARLASLGTHCYEQHAFRQAFL